MTTGSPDHAGTVVLLEGPSDVAAVRAVAAAYGLTDRTHRYQLVDMGGVTNIRRHVTAWRRASSPVRIIGMCDAGEARFLVRALHVEDDGKADDAVLAEHGFSVCEADLEDELIRALGTDRVVGVLRRLGLEGRLATFRRQPAWRDRPLHEQLRRFAGTTSGRKTLLAGALVEELGHEEVPTPLHRLVTTMAGDELVAPDPVSER